MVLWVIKGGRQGEREAKMLSESIIAIGWEELPDLAPVRSKEALQRLLEKAKPDSSKASIANQTGQIWAFRETAKTGDLVVAPLKSTSTIAIGRITGDYFYSTKYGPNMLHLRPVEWIKKDLPRNKFAQDLLYTFGAFMTFSRAERNNAEQRVKRIIEGRSIPEEKLGKEVEAESEPERDYEQLAKDQITEFIEQQFKGHALASLVASILKAQGFVIVHISPPGADGGVDVLASSGTLGLEEPRICVQVKSSDTALGTPVLDQLRGTMENVDATHGILASWGGFKETVRKVNRDKSFKVSLWDGGRIVDELLKNYDKLDPEVKARLPLKQAWVLAAPVDVSD